jgi:hypothetical protein
VMPAGACRRPSPKRRTNPSTCARS